MSDELWAKSTGETLYQHTMEVVDAVKQVVANLPDGVFDQSVLLTDLVLCATFHDVGKAAIGFQDVLHGQSKDWHGKRHEVLSTAFAAHCTELPDEALLAILTHHRTLPVDGNAGNEKAAIPSDQIPDEDTAVWAQMVREFDANRGRFEVFWIDVCNAIGRSYLITLAPIALGNLRLGSAWLKQSGINRYGQLKKIPFDKRKRAALYRGLLVTADHMASGKTPPRPLSDLTRPTIYKGTLRGFQEKCCDTKQNAILRAPTGSGKTESSLLWMQANWRKNSRVFYVLPYTASINAMHKRLVDIFGSESVNVLHGKASAYLYSLLKEDKTSLDAQAQAQSLKQLSKEMYFPIRVCTPHQILRYALRGRGWEQMLGEFPQACFIFDEIHAYDAHMTGLILGAARMATKWDARLLFATATMPNFLKELIQQAAGMSENQVITPNFQNEKDREVLDKKRHWVEVWDGGLIDRIDDILNVAEDCPHTLIVCNHVRTAHQVFEKCQARFVSNAILLHSRFAAKDRNKIEQDLLKSLPRVLVATQVVEVSLNLDFYQAFLEPAPIDAEAQRMGRVNRYGARPPARVIVMSEQVNRHKLYDTDKSKQTVGLLRNIQNPISEDTLIEISNQVYADGYRGEDLELFEQALHNPNFEQLEDKLIAGVHHDWADEAFDEQDDRIEILPGCYEEDYAVAMKAGNWLEATSMLVSLSYQMVDSMRKKNRKNFRSVDDSVEPWIIHKPYDSIRGLRLDADQDAED